MNVNILIAPGDALFVPISIENSEWHFKGPVPDDLGVTFISLSPPPSSFDIRVFSLLFPLCHELPPVPNILPLPEFVWLSCLQQIELEKQALLKGVSGFMILAEEGKGTRQYPTGSDSLQII